MLLVECALSLGLEISSIGVEGCLFEEVSWQERFLVPKEYN